MSLLKLCWTFSTFHFIMKITWLCWRYYSVFTNEETELKRSRFLLQAHIGITVTISSWNQVSLNRQSKHIPCVALILLKPQLLCLKDVLSLDWKADLLWSVLGWFDSPQCSGLSWQKPSTGLGEQVQNFWNPPQRPFFGWLGIYWQWIYY